MYNVVELSIKLCAFALYLLLFLDVIEAYKQCKVPNGDAGRCINISKCKPLMDLSNKPFKTRHENMYLQQSFCGAPGATKFKVCCPPKSLWNRFEANPVFYPHEKPPQPSITPTPITNSPITEVFRELIPTRRSEELKYRITPEEAKREEEEIRNKCGIDASSPNKIINGQAAEIDQYAWLVLLEYFGGKLECGGSLISHRFVLTAAHCINTGSAGPPLFARLAEYNTTSYPTDDVEVNGGGIESITVDIVEVKSTEVHPKFNREEKINDIGLVELKRSANLSSDFIKVICLPERNFIPEFNASTKFIVAGWGSTGEGIDGSDVKLQVTVPYVHGDQCKNFALYNNVFRSYEMKTQICAGGEGGRDSCRGDSGGPLMYFHNERYYAVGLVSYGPIICGSNGEPGIYTNVFEYLPWIKQTMESKTMLV